MSLDPKVTQWYQRQDSGEIFKVVAVDPATGDSAIEVSPAATSVAPPPAIAMWTCSTSASSIRRN